MLVAQVKRSTPLNYVAKRILSTTASDRKPAKLNLSNTETPAKIRQAWFAPEFPVQKMTQLLDHDNHEMRQKFREFISEPVMIPRYFFLLFFDKYPRFRISFKYPLPFLLYFCLTEWGCLAGAHLGLLNCVC